MMSDATRVALLRGLEIDPHRQEVVVSGESVRLTPTEYRVLSLLANNPGKVYSRRQLIDLALGADSPTSERSIDVHVAGIRKKLNSVAGCLETIRNEGYRFKP